MINEHYCYLSYIISRFTFACLMLCYCPSRVISDLICYNSWRSLLRYNFYLLYTSLTTTKLKLIEFYES